MSKSSKTNAKREAGVEDDPAAANGQPDVRTVAADAAENPAPEGRLDTAAGTQRAGSDIFRPLADEGGDAPMRDLDMIMDIPVKLSVELGRTRLTIKQLLELAQGSVVELDGLPGEPMDILINGYLIARGEVVVVEDRFGIRITEIVTPSERLHRLNS